jgi:hypothetical protein
MSYTGGGALTGFGKWPGRGAFLGLRRSMKTKTSLAARRAAINNLVHVGDPSVPPE